MWNWHQRSTRDLGPDRPRNLVLPMKWRCDVCDGLQFLSPVRMTLGRLVDQVNSYVSRGAKQ